MRAHCVVKGEPFADHAVRDEAIGQLMQIDRLVFEQTPQPLDEDIVHAASPAVHRDRDVRALEHAGEVEAGELAALIGVEDFRFSVFGQRRSLVLNRNLAA